MDAVARLDQLVTDLRILLWGNEETRNGGLLREVDALKTEVLNLRADVNDLKAHRGNRGMWAVGYTCLCLAVAFALLGVANLGGHQLWDVPATFAIGLSGFFVLAAVPAFWSAYGWLK